MFVQKQKNTEVRAVACFWGYCTHRVRLCAYVHAHVSVSIPETSPMISSRPRFILIVIDGAQDTSVCGSLPQCQQIDKIEKRTCVRIRANKFCAVLVPAQSERNHVHPCSDCLPSFACDKRSLGIFFTNLSLNLTNHSVKIFRWLSSVILLLVGETSLHRRHQRGSRMGRDCKNGS